MCSGHYSSPKHSIEQARVTGMEALQVPDVVLGCISTLVVGWLLHWVYKWMRPPCNGKLPPGSMGLPIVGETFQFFRPSPSLGIPDFYKERLKRYGPVFKTSLVGQQVVVSMDAELNQFIFQQEGKLFRSWYPDTSNSIFGKESINSYDGIHHRYVRTLAAHDFGPNSLKGPFLTEMANVVASSLQAWAAQPSIEIKEAVSNMIFDMTAKKLIGLDVARARELRKNYESFFQGLIAFPLYLPGTTFYQCMQGRKKVLSVLKELLKERLSAPEKRHGDLLDVVVDDLQSEKPVATEKFAIDVISALLFASFASIAATLSVAMKFLTENPKVVEALTEEHETILKKREGVDSSITWDEYKSMTFTAQVTNELTRVGNVAPGIFRKTLKDVQVNGYTIPAGWLVLISPMAVHLNPSLFEDPLNFNPWRWQMVTNARLPSLFHGQPYRAGDQGMPGAGTVELGPHNIVHRWSGDLSRANHENMGAYYSSARDPIFYPHHANSDRLWEVWRGAGGGHADFTDPDWLDSSFLFYDEDARLVRVAVRDVLDIGRLRYAYADVGLPWLRARPPVVVAPDDVDVNRGRGPPTNLKSVRFPVSLDAAVTAEVSRRPGKPRRQWEEEVLVVEGIEADGAGFVKFDVYVNAADHEKVGPGGREMAGSFVSLKHPSKVVVQTTMRVALNEILEDLGAAGDDSITVTLVPVEGRVRVGGLRIVYMAE